MSSFYGTKQNPVRVGLINLDSLGGQVSLGFLNLLGRGLGPVSYA